MSPPIRLCRRTPINSATTTSLTLADLEAYRDQGPAARAGGEERYFCPLHGSDHQRSLTVNPDTGEYFCHSCNASGVLSDHAGNGGGDSIGQLAGIRSWDVGALTALGARSLNGCVQFPMRDAAGLETGFKRRRANNEPFSGGAKSLMNRGGQAGLFYAMPLPAEGAVVVVEGETDAAGALSAGWKAVVGTAGSNPGKVGKLALAALLRGRDVVLAPDPDEAGAKLAGNRWIGSEDCRLSSAGYPT